MPRMREDGTTWVRDDYAERYDSIVKSYGSFAGKSLIDIGCSEGYFVKRFLDDGGVKAIGVEPNTKYNESFIVRNISEVYGIFNVCLYLDLHYHTYEGISGFELNYINYFPWIKNNCGTLFVAPSGVGNNDKLEHDLINTFGNCEFVSRSSYANRNIYKVRIK